MDLETGEFQASLHRNGALPHQCSEDQTGIPEIGCTVPFQGGNEIRKGSSILIFPEGTRSKTREMRPFKEGAFLLAKKMGCGIIPVIHTGSENTFDRGSWVLKGRARIHIKVLDEIPPGEVKAVDVKVMMARVRKVMEEGIAQLEREKTAG